MPEAVTSKLPCRHLSRFICLHHAKQIPSSRKHASEACQPCKSHQSTKQQLTSACSADTNMIQHAVPAVQSSDLVAACTRQQRHVSRRELLQVAASAALLLQAAPKAQASALPQAVDNAWSSLGGGPSDLTFPDLFLGTWRVQATLTKVETPLGPDFVPDMKVVERARQEDLQQPQKYLVTFMRNSRGQVIIDRRFNTAQLMGMYMNKPLSEDSITWNPDNPNQLRMSIPGSMAVTTRVTRRLQETPAPDKLSTSEYFQQIFETPNKPKAKVKASQCYTKYKFRSQEAADQMAGPAIVATQVISDYLTAYDGELQLLKSQNRPVAVYTYTLVFVRPRGLAL